MPIGYPTLYHLNSKLLVRYSRHGLKNRPFDKQTVLDHLNTELVCYSDPHCTLILKNEEFCTPEVYLSCKFFVIFLFQLIGVIVGLVWGVLAVQGSIGLVGFAAINAGLVRFQKTKI